jgi:hypothetical protein
MQLLCQAVLFFPSPAIRRACALKSTAWYSGYISHRCGLSIQLESLFAGYWRTCSAWKSVAKNMAALTPFPWQLVRSLHGNCHWPTAIRNIKQSLAPPCFYTNISEFRGFRLFLSKKIFPSHFTCFTMRRKSAVLFRLFMQQFTIKKD